MLTGHEIVDNILGGAWVVISQMNGNPELNQSGARFLIAIFFLYLLYATIRMRAMAQFRPHQIIALVGCVLMIVREMSMLVCMSGWELGLFKDPFIHFLWPPVEHFFETAAYLCFAWYTIEASGWGWLRCQAHRLMWWVIGFVLLFSVWALIEWKSFFMAALPYVLHAYRESPVDWQSHVILTLIAFCGCAAAWMRKRGSSYLLMFWSIVFVEHAVRTVVFAFFIEQAWQATIFHALHTWSIPLLLLHFINAYVIKMSSCVVCRRDVLLEETK